VNDCPAPLSTINFLLNNFEATPKRYLTRAGFLSFYISQTIGDTEETWKDLAKLGYNRALALTPQ